jgi:large subunit ribosomal protein L15
MPLIRRIPKRGFNNAEFCTEYAVVNVEQLNAFDDGAEVNPQTLEEKGIVRSLLDGLKVLGGGELKKKLTVKAHAFSASAKDKIAKAGGQCEMIRVESKRTHLPKAESAPAATAEPKA